jgi:cysteine-rich repeat protein
MRAILFGLLAFLALVHCGRTGVELADTSEDDPTVGALRDAGPDARIDDAASDAMPGDSGLVDAPEDSRTDGPLDSGTDATEPECGNYLVEDDEECDDGNLVEGDYCNATCTRVTGRCGDNVIQDNETCEGTSMRDGTSCSDLCQLTFDGVMLAAGLRHTCGLRADGTVTCWGSNPFGDEVPAGRYRHISAHESWASGLLNDGSAVFWGRFDLMPPEPAGPYLILEPGVNGYCAIRPNGNPECWNFPDLMPSRKLANVSVFTRTACGVARSGELACWGDQDPELWEGEYRSVAVGGAFICAIRDDRTLVCDDEDYPPPPGEFTAITAGYTFQCALRTNAEVACWGARSVAGSLDPPPGKFALIDAGWRHVCGVRMDGTTICWGSNSEGEADAPEDFP